MLETLPLSHLLREQQNDLLATSAPHCVRPWRSLCVSFPSSIFLKSLWKFILTDKVVSQMVRSRSTPQIIALSAMTIPMGSHRECLSTSLVWKAKLNISMKGRNCKASCAANRVHFVLFPMGSLVWRHDCLCYILGHWQRVGFHHRDLSSWHLLILQNW